MMMKRISAVTLSVAMAASSLTAFAQNQKLVDRLNAAKEVVTEIMATPDKGIPQHEPGATVVAQAIRGIPGKQLGGVPERAARVADMAPRKLVLTRRGVRRGDRNGARSAI